MLERKLCLTVRHQQQAITAVDVVLPASPVAALLQGKNVAQALQLIPLLLVVCAQAQSAASIVAVTAAQGKMLPINFKKRLSWLVALESVQESLRMLTFCLPEDLRPPEMKEDFATAWQQSAVFIALLRKNLFLADGELFACSDHELEEMQAGTREIALLWDQFCSAYVHGESTSIWQPKQVRMGMTPMLRWLEQMQSELEALSWLELPELPLSQLRSGELNWCDRVNGAYEAGVFRRVAPQLDGIEGQNVAAIRLWGRLVDVAETLKWLIEPEAADHALTNIRGAVLKDASAMAEVECARGVLLHGVSLEGDRIKAYELYAPTDWAFHVEGILSCLKGHWAKDLATLQRDVKWLVQMLDPCVEFDVTLIEGDASA